MMEVPSWQIAWLGSSDVRAITLFTTSRYSVLPAFRLRLKCQIDLKRDFTIEIVADYAESAMIKITHSKLVSDGRAEERWKRRCLEVENAM